MFILYITDTKEVQHRRNYISTRFLSVSISFPIQLLLFVFPHMSYLPQRYRKISADVALNNGSQGDSTQLAMCLSNYLLTVSVCVGHEDGNDDDDYDDYCHHPSSWWSTFQLSFPLIGCHQ